MTTRPKKARVRPATSAKAVGVKRPRAQTRQSSKSQDSANRKGPEWNAETHTLFFDGRAIKHFKSAAPHEEPMLAAFQSAGWLPLIDVDLLLKGAVGSKLRMHQTIDNLNRNVAPHLHFFLEGSSTRIGWRRGGGRKRRNAT